MNSGFSESTLRIIGVLSLAYGSGYIVTYLIRWFFPSVRKAAEDAEWHGASEEACRQNMMGGRVEYRCWSDDTLMWTDPLNAGHFTTTENAYAERDVWLIYLREFRC